MTEINAQQRNPLRDGNAITSFSAAWIFLLSNISPNQLTQTLGSENNIVAYTKGNKISDMTHKNSGSPW